MFLSWIIYPTNYPILIILIKVLVTMKKRIMLVLGLILLVNFVSVLSCSANAYSPFNTVTAGDQLSWIVRDYNETNNLVEPCEWWRYSDFTFQGEFVLWVGDVITFTVNNPLLGNGALKIGNLSLALATRDDLGFNLNLFTAPAFPPFQNNSFTPGLLASTNWSAQITAAVKTAEELKGSIMIQTFYQEFLGQSRAVIAFYYSQGDQISNAIYDNATGILLQFYTKHQLWWLGFTITLPSEVPSFVIFFTICALSGLIIIMIVRKKSCSIPHANSRY